MRIVVMLVIVMLVVVMLVVVMIVNVDRWMPVLVGRFDETDSVGQGHTQYQGGRQFCPIVLVKPDFR